MIAHVVLFRPRPELPEADREAFAGSFEHAVTRIPFVRTARVGRRVSLGRAYEAMNSQEFSYVAVLEFDSESDLRGYLDHPAHQELGERFYQIAAAALVYDFDLVDGARVRELLS